MKLLSVNIERSKHMARVQAFIEAQKPDVLCVQELCMRDIPFIEDLMGQKLTYAPMVMHPAEEELQTIGVAFVARKPVKQVQVEYYHGHLTQTPPEVAFYDEEGRMRVDTTRIYNALVWAEVDGLTISTTHFPWSPEGHTTPFHLMAASRLLEVILPFKTKPFVMCGDMNAPRGRGTFGVFAEHFTDAIPPHYTTSIDGTLHRAGPLNLMVDVLFHTPLVQATDVQLHTGVSDHCAITATLQRT